MNRDQLESEIQAKGLTAPRVTPAVVEAAVASEHYFTGADGALGAMSATDIDPFTAFARIPQSLHLLTICVLVMRNGFTVIGTSACASPENFNAEIGRKVARQKAIDQVWALEGYLLRDKIATET